MPLRQMASLVCAKDSGWNLVRNFKVRDRFAQLARLVVCSGLCVALGLAALMGSGIPHGHDYQLLIALLFAGLGAALVAVSIYSSRLKLRWPIMLTIVFIPFVIFIPWEIAWYVDKVDTDYKLKNTVVSNVTDTPVITPSGNLIGIKISFFVRPSNGLSKHIQKKPKEVYEQYSEKSSHYSINMHSVRSTVTPFPTALNQNSSEELLQTIPTSGLFFEKDLKSRFDVEMTPLFLALEQKSDALCLVKPDDENVFGLKTSYAWQAHADINLPYEVRITNTNYGDRREPEKATQHSYIPSVIYSGILNEGFPFCESSQ